MGWLAWRSSAQLAPVQALGALPSSHHKVMVGMVPYPFLLTFEVFVGAVHACIVKKVTQL